jgi:uncharacterized protein (TIGR02147 family)
VSTGRKSQNMKIERPDIYGYHDFRSFLKDWFAYLKRRDPRFSVRKLSQEIQLSSGFLSQVLGGSRNFSVKVMLRLIPQLHLNRSEQSYFESLVRLGTVPSREGKISALDKMSRYAAYQRRNPNEAHFFQYISRWYNVAIREMAMLPEFKPDPQWIQDRLKMKLPLHVIEKSIRFLLDAGYLIRSPDGTVTSTKENLDCMRIVQGTALVQNHKQMFTLATESMDNSPESERNIEGFTFATTPKRFEMARQILTEALDRIEALEFLEVPEEKDKDGAVYQVEIALFPLTKWGRA